MFNFMIFLTLGVDFGYEIWHHISQGFSVLFNKKIKFHSHIILQIFYNLQYCSIMAIYWSQRTFFIREHSTEGEFFSWADIISKLMCFWVSEVQLTKFKGPVRYATKYKESTINRKALTMASCDYHYFLCFTNPKLNFEKHCIIYQVFQKSGPISIFPFYGI